MTLDLHAPQIQGFFKVPVDDLYALPVFVEYFREKEIPNLVVASPDVGFGKQAYKFAEMIHCQVVFGNKVRRGHDEQAEMLDIVGDVRGKNVLIVDDFTISGGTLIEMAIACKVKAWLQGCLLSASRTASSRESAGQDRPQSDQGSWSSRIPSNTASNRSRPAARSSASPASSPTPTSMSIHRRESVSRLFNY